MCKYFFSITYSLFVTAKLIVKKCVFLWITKFNFFFLAHEKKYLILIELLTLNSNV